MQINVETMKYGHIPHYSFPNRLIARTPEVWILWGEFGRPLIHHTKGFTVAVENRSLEFYWRDRPYTVGAHVAADGSIQGYYCNVILPPTMDGDRVEWIDLDLDLLVDADLTWRVVDEDDFAINQVKFGYPPDVIQAARDGLQELIELVESRGFPFDGSAERMAKEMVATAP